MPEEINQESVYKIADKFINIANEITKEDSSGAVGVGIRYAAARYSSFEATLTTDDLARDKEKIIEDIVNDYRQMLRVNIDQYINIQAGSSR